MMTMTILLFRSVLPATVWLPHFVPKFSSFYSLVLCLSNCCNSVHLLKIRGKNTFSPLIWHLFVFQKLVKKLCQFFYSWLVYTLPGFYWYLIWSKCLFICLRADRTSSSAICCISTVTYQLELLFLAWDFLHSSVF